MTVSVNLKSATYNLQQTTISNFAAFSKIANILPYFFSKIRKDAQNLSSAAVVIGALRVKHSQAKGQALTLSNSEEATPPMGYV